MSRKLLGRIKLREWTHHVPRAVVNYAGLAILDMGFTLFAFAIGVKEGNPILEWYQRQGLFEVVKISSTLAVIWLGFTLWEVKAVRWVIYAANVLMFGVLVFHLVFWIRVINGLDL